MPTQAHNVVPYQSAPDRPKPALRLVSSNLAWKLAPPPKPAEIRTWKDARDFMAKHRHLMSSWHKGFLKSMLTWRDGYRVSEKQRACIARALCDINERLSDRRMRAVEPIGEQGSEGNGPNSAA
jgi:hypothetical protein